MSDLMTCEPMTSAISSPESASGRTRFDAPGGLTIDLFGPVPVRANLSPRQAKELGLMTSGTCGLRGTGSSASADLQSSLESRLRAQLSILGSTLYTLTWKRWTTPSGVSRFRLRASAPRISETARTGWPTPTACEAGGTPGQFVARKLKSIAKGSKMGASLTDLGMVAQMAGWPTTTSTDALRKPSMEFATTNITLNHAAVLAGWRTPTCQSPNSLRGNGQDPAKRLTQGHTINLTDEVNWLKDNPHPARLTASGELLTGSSAGMESGGQLNPAHSRWLMGLPPEWDDCAPTATRSTPKRRRNSSSPRETS